MKRLIVAYARNVWRPTYLVVSWDAYRLRRPAPINVRSARLGAAELREFAGLIAGIPSRQSADG